VPNAVFADTRLSVEAKGVLGYLLSRPHEGTFGSNMSQARSKSAVESSDESSAS
jgi:hypothetical protein